MGVSYFAVGMGCRAGDGAHAMPPRHWLREDSEKLGGWLDLSRCITTLVTWRLCRLPPRPTGPRMSLGRVVRTQAASRSCRLWSHRRACVTASAHSSRQGAGTCFKVPPWCAKIASVCAISTCDTRRGCTEFSTGKEAGGSAEGGSSPGFVRRQESLGPGARHSRQLSP